MFLSFPAENTTMRLHGQGGRGSGLTFWKVGTRPFPEQRSAETLAECHAHPFGKACLLLEAIGVGSLQFKVGTVAAKLPWIFIIVAQFILRPVGSCGAVGVGRRESPAEDNYAHGHVPRMFRYFS
jgi:hypothetical protein